MLIDDRGFVNSIQGRDFDAETDALILESALMDLPTDDLESLLEDTHDIATAISENIVLEKSIVRLDKQAKLSKARKMAIFAIAKEKKDPKFKKLITIWKWERFIETYLDKKYGNEAMRRAKKTVSNAAKSNSKMVKSAGKSLNKSLKSLQPGGKYAKHNSYQPKTKLNLASKPGNR